MSLKWIATSLRLARRMFSLFRPRFWSWGLVIMLSVGLTSCGTLVEPTPAVARGDFKAVVGHMQSFIAREMRDQKVAGLSIALVADQRVLWAEGFGWADVQEKRPATPETVYRAGSISKLFTATAVMQMVAQDRLRLDQSVQAVLPEFKLRSRFGDAREITVRQLLTHHAGLPRDLGRGMWTQTPVRFTEVTQALGELDAAYPPDTVFSYSNLGFDVLGHVLERVSGVDFERQLQAAVLRPLGMSRSSFSAPLPSGDQVARAYQKSQPALETALRDLPAGGLNTTVLDLSRYLSMVFAQGRSQGAEILPPALLTQMLAVQNQDHLLDMGFRNGLAWMLSTLGARTIQGAGVVAHHGGSTLNFHSQMYALPEHQLGVVVMSNDASAHDVVDRVAVRALSLALQAHSGITQPVPVKAPDGPERFTPAMLQAYAGDYTTALGHARIVRREGDRLAVEALGQEFELQAVQGQQSRLVYKVLGLVPISLGTLDQVTLSRRRVADREVLLAHSAGQAWLIGEKMAISPRTTPLPPLAGRYEFLNRPADDPFQGTVRIDAREGFFLVQLTNAADAGMPSIRPMVPVSGEAAVLTASLNQWGEMVRWRMVDGQPELSFSGYVLRRVGD